MQSFRQNVTRIKGLSDRRRMPLLGKVRLGIKVKHKTKDVSYPKETDYFVVDDAVKELYGAKPKKLDIMLPMNDLDAVFPTAYVWYGSGKGVKCKGDGERSWCVDPDTKEVVEKTCPCEQLENGKCKQVGRLLFMIPSVSVAGVYQLSTSSYNSIIDIQSGLDYVQALVGRFAWITLELKRVPTITHHDDKKQTHYTIQLTLPSEFNLKALSDLKADNERIFTQAQYQLPAPVEENPELEPVDIVEDEEEPREPEKTENTTTTSFDFLKSVRELKKELNNDEAYYNLLGVHGYEKSNQITDRKVQIEFYRDLALEAKKKIPDEDIPL